MNAKTSPPQSESPRIRLARKTAILQLKLLADGLRDAVLIPLSLAAGLIGLVRGGEEADREFGKVVKLGRRSERWINLFGHHRPLMRSHPAGSIDTIIDRVESVVREQYRKGRTSAEGRSAIEEALENMRADGKNDA